MCRNSLTKHVIKDQRTEDKEELVSSYWMTFKEARRYGTLKEEALHGTLRKEGTDLSSEYMMMMVMMTAYDAVVHERYPPRVEHTVFT
jgi:flagellar motor component MotA